MKQTLYRYVFANGSPGVDDLLASGWEIVLEFERHRSFLMRLELPDWPDTESKEDAVAASAI